MGKKVIAEADMNQYFDRIWKQNTIKSIYRLAFVCYLTSFINDICRVKRKLWRFEVILTPFWSRENSRQDVDLQCEVFLMNM